MSKNNQDLSANDAWKAMLEKYNIMEEIKRNGCFILRPVKSRGLKNRD